MSPRATGGLLAAGLLLTAAQAGAQGLDIPLAPETMSYPSLHLGGFSDFNFYSEDTLEGGTESGFREGQFILHFTAALSPRVSFFAEASTTARSSGYSSAMERAILTYRHSDELKLSVGRYHTPINWWNTAYHHGHWLQTTAQRPEMTKFGGQFIAVHFDGVLVEGVTHAGGLNLGYEAAVGNGRSESVSGAGEAGDSNNHRAWVVRLGVRPDALYKLQAGLAYYGDKVTLPSRADFDEGIVAAYLVWASERPELIAEYADVDHEAANARAEQAAGTRTFGSDAYYLQAAWRLPGNLSKLKPYARYEEMDIATGDPVYAAVPSLERSILGLRWDVFELVALKTELRRDSFDGSEDLDGVFMQVAFAF